MNDMEMFAARTQRHLTYLLVYGFLVLILIMIIASFLPFPVNDKLSGTVSALIDGLLSLTSGAVGYWIARHRPNSDPTTPVNPAPSPGVTQ